MTHPTDNIVFVPIVGGPLDGRCVQWDTTAGGWPPRLRLTVDRVFGGERCVHVWDPVNEVFVCRYREPLDAES